MRLAQRRNMVHHSFFTIEAVLVTNQIKNTQLYIFGCKIGCKSRKSLIIKRYCGERGIRTPGTSRYDGFQDRCNRPLYHLSKKLRGVLASKAVQRYGKKIISPNFLEKNYRIYYYFSEQWLLLFFIGTFNVLFYLTRISDGDGA